MKIAFIPGSCAPFHGKTLEERPLGGIETSVIRLAEALDRVGHTVFVFSHAERPPVSKPLYLPLRALEDVGSVDVLVAVRELLPLFCAVPARATFFWTGDSYDQLQHLGLGDRRVMERLSALWAVSWWQAERLCAVSGFSLSKAWVVPNGYAAELFEGTEVRNRKRLIYSSTPYRGLEHFLALMPMLRASHPDVELHVFSGLDVYRGAGRAVEQMELRFRPLFERLSKMEGVTLHGNVTQAVLAREFMRSAILAYPNVFEETSCITAIEAMAAGCPIVTSRWGALPETIGDAGIFVDAPPTSPQYRGRFAEAVNGLLADPSAWQTLHQRALERAATMSWDSVARAVTDRMRSYLSANSGPSCNVDLSGGVGVP